MGAGLPTRIRLDIVTPERLILSEEVEAVTFPGSEGYLGILPGHLPLLTTLGIGILVYQRAGKRYHFSISGGYAEVLPDRVIIMPQTAERPEEIDIDRARSSKERAEKRLGSKESIDVERAMGSLLRAVSRLQVAEIR